MQELKLRRQRIPRGLCAPKPGMAALLAMLYLTLIASLAVGFYAAANSANIVSENEKRTGLSHAAAESGMDFMRYQLAQVTIPAGTTQDQLFSSLYSQLRDNINNTGNMQGKTISNDGNFIQIPSGAGEYLRSGAAGGEFRASI